MSLIIPITVWDTCLMRAISPHPFIFFIQTNVAGRKICQGDGRLLLPPQITSGCESCEASLIPSEISRKTNWHFRCRYGCDIFTCGMLKWLPRHLFISLIHILSFCETAFSLFSLVVSFLLLTDWVVYRQLRARRVLLQLKDVLLRTRRALLLYKVNGNSALLFLNGTSLICNSALLPLSWRYILMHFLYKCIL